MKVHLPSTFVTAIVRAAFLSCGIAPLIAQTLPRRDVDLQITAVHAEGLSQNRQSLAIAGTVTATINNLGVETVDQDFEVVFFEDRDLDELFDPRFDNRLGSVTSSEAIGPLQSLELQAILSGELQFSGNRILALVDAQNEIAETDENNNLGNSAGVCGLPLQSTEISPTLQMAWTGGGASPLFNQVIATPVVIHLNDDNGDGNIGAGDVPEIVFAATDNIGSGAGLSPGILRAINGKTGSLSFEVIDPVLRVQTGGQIAAGDIDGDGFAEIMAPASDANHLLCFEHDGRFKWQSPEIRIDLGGASVADLNQDSRPEIVVGATILGSEGQLVARGNFSTGRNGGTGPLSIVADLDLDGLPEIIAGNTAYRADGTLFWQNELVDDGFAAIANFDDDRYPEIALISRGFLSLLEHDGSLKWGPHFIPGGGEGGAPTIADVDGDGAPEIGLAGARKYSVFESEGAVKWSHAINDVSSGLASSTMFDFENDGGTEIVYGDQNRLFFFNGATGDVRFDIQNPSGTLLENPVVADVDGDGRAELLAVRNQISQRDSTAPQDQGIFVFVDSANAWAETRPVWNQYGYHVTNVTHDGRIPTQEASSWLTHNTFRSNLITESRRLQYQPDLTPSRLVYDSARNELSARVGNGGKALAPSGIKVFFFMEDSAGTLAPIAIAATSSQLAPGAFEDVAVSWVNNSADSIQIVVIVDNDEPGPGEIAECNELNNCHEAGFPAVQRLLVRIEAPSDSTYFFCDDSVQVIASVIMAGSDSLPPAIYEINGQPATLNGNLFTANLATPFGPLLIVASCQTTTGQFAADSIVIFNARESDPPFCTFDFHKSYIGVTATDSGSGIAQISPTRVRNGNLILPSFSPGTKQVVFRVEAVDSTQAIGFVVRVTDRCGNVLLADPVFMEVAADAGQLEYDIAFPAEDRYLTVENRGLSSLAFELNSESFVAGQAITESQRAFPLPVFGAITIDLHKHLQAGENLLHLTIPNEPGRSAVLTLMDVAARVDYVLVLAVVPREFALWQNYPNPFREETRIEFDVPSDDGNQDHFVELDIYNTVGQKVKTLLEQELRQGRHQIIWKGRDDADRSISAGVYVYQLRVGNAKFTRRMVLLKN